MKIFALYSLFDGLFIVTKSSQSSLQSTPWKYIQCVIGKYKEGNDAVKVGKCAAKSLVVASYLPQQQMWKSGHTIQSFNV